MSLSAFQRRRRELAAKQAAEEAKAAAQQTETVEPEDAPEKSKRWKKGGDEDVGS